MASAAKTKRMQLKPIAVIAVLSLVVASLSVAGCTVRPTVEIGNQQTNQAGYVSTAYPASGRSQLVQACVDYDRNQRWPFDTYNVTWINDTAAQATGTEKTGEGSRVNIMTSTMTYTHFPTVEAASAYFDSLRSQYPKKHDYISASDAAPYFEVTGKLPAVTKQLNNDKLISSDYSRTLAQQDGLITQRAVTFYYPNTETNQA